MILHYRSLDHASLIVIEADLDASGCAALRGEIYAAAAMKQKVIVSLEDCDFCDLSGIRTVLEAKRWLKHRMCIVIPPGHIAHRLIAILGWAELIEPCDHLSEALIWSQSDGADLDD